MCVSSVVSVCLDLTSCTWELDSLVGIVPSYWLALRWRVIPSTDEVLFEYCCMGGTSVVSCVVGLFCGFTIRDSYSGMGWFRGQL